MHPKCSNCGLIKRGMSGRPIRDEWGTLQPSCSIDGRCGSSSWSGSRSVVSSTDDEPDEFKIKTFQRVLNGESGRGNFRDFKDYESWVESERLKEQVMLLKEELKQLKEGK